MKTILITGVSSGFGKLSLKKILKAGNLVLAGIRGGEERLYQMAEANSEDRDILDALKSGRLKGCDLHMDKADTFSRIHEILETHFKGKLDVLINNAGYGLIGPLEAMGPEDIEYQMDVNFNGPALLTKECLPYLRKSSGRIINISSVLGIKTLPFYSAYCASKYALEGFSEALHYELKPFGIDTCLIEPGSFKTKFVEVALKQGNSLKTHPAYQARTDKLNELLQNSSRVAGDPDKVASLITKYVGSKSVPIRKAVGADGIIMSLVNSFIPNSLYVWSVEFFFRMAVFKGV
ncbi:MAG: SDR family oxidoreductase [Bacteriovoracaceae bacterium]|nr:SDR family oxidoreductase [Bacteriovoracaceae bacterium]